jgi:hypothetical protein
MFQTKDMIPQEKKRGMASSPLNKINSPGVSDKINRKPAIYPEFQEASEYAIDEGWKEMLISASRGVFANKSIIYSNRILYKKGSQFSEKMPEDPENLCKAFMKFHKKNDGILSSMDIEKQKDIENKIIDQEIQLKWSLCTKKMKRSRLFDYAIRACSSEHIDNRNHCISNLSSTLMLAFNDGILSDDNVKMSNNIIVRVKCVKRDKKDNTIWWLKT